jgi:hypothetical protein
LWVRVIGAQSEDDESKQPVREMEMQVEAGFGPGRDWPATVIALVNLQGSTRAQEVQIPGGFRIRPRNGGEGGIRTPVTLLG